VMSDVNIAALGNLPGAVVDDLIRVVTLYAAVMASGSLAYLVGCGVASNDSDQVSYLQHRMVLTEAIGDASLSAPSYAMCKYSSPKFLSLFLLNG